MKAALLTEYGRPIEVEDVTPVTPNDDDVVVRMTASAYCYTDCLNQRGMRGLPRTLPTIVGHAAVGVVEHAGPALTRVKEGDHVLLPGTPECEVFEEALWRRTFADEMPPPLFELARLAVFPVTRLAASMVSWPPLKIPPPTPPSTPVDVLPLTVLLFSVSAPDWVTIPPPARAAVLPVMAQSVRVRKVLKSELL